MKKLIALLGLCLLSACHSVQYPTVEESQKVIDQFNPKLEAADEKINSLTKNLPDGKDLILKLSVKPLNTIVQKIAFQREDDINLNFLQSKGLFYEQKSLLGINYTNYIDVDKGYISVNLKNLKFEKAENGKIYARIEIEGKGNISVSGKYMGAPASVSPDVHLYLDEPIILDMSPSKTGYIKLTPEPKTMILKTKISIKLLQWDAPWYKEIPLNLTDLLQPIELPIGLKNEINFPIPAKNFGDNKVEFAPYIMELTSPSINCVNNYIDYRANIDFKKK